MPKKIIDQSLDLAAQQEQQKLQQNQQRAEREIKLNNLATKLLDIDWSTQMTPALYKEVLMNVAVLERFKTEGYWYSDNPVNQKYPMPIENSFDPVERAQFLPKLQKIEDDLLGSKNQQNGNQKDKKLKYGAHMSFMGSSDCRCCNKNNGTGEFFYQGRSWPDGFKHYVVDHGVKPSPDFIAFVEKTYEYMISLEVKPDKLNNIEHNNSKNKKRKM